MSAETAGNNDNTSNTDSQSEDHFSDATETDLFTLLDKGDDDGESSDEDDETGTDSSGDEDSSTDSVTSAVWDNHFKSVVGLHQGDVDGGSSSEDEGDFYKIACKQAEHIAKTAAIEKQKAKDQAQEGEAGSLQNNEEEDVTVTVKLTTTVELNGDDNAAGNNFEGSDAGTVVSDGKDLVTEDRDAPPQKPQSPPPVVKVNAGPSSGNLKGPVAAKANGGLDPPVDPHPLYTASLKYVYPRPKEDGGKEKPTKFAKHIPIDPSETWDFSMQGLLEDYKSNVLWVDGSFYQKFLDDCLHEMANRTCFSQCKNENGEVRKIAMCRKCHVPFCSNQCFKKAKQKQSGEIDSDEATDIIASGNSNQPEKPKQSQTLKNNLSLNSGQNVYGNNKPSYKDVCNKRDALPDKPGKPYQNFKSNQNRDGNFGGGYNHPQRNHNQQFQNNYPYPPPGPGPNYPGPGPLTSPTQKFYPTQVLANNLVQRKSLSPPHPPQDSSQKILRNPVSGARSPHLSETGSNSGEDSKSFFSNNWKKKGQRQNPGNFPNPIQNKGEPFPPAPGFPNGPPSLNAGFPRNRNDSQFHPQQSGDDGNWRSKKQQQPFFNNNMPADTFSRPFNDNRGGGGAGGSGDFNYPTPYGQVPDIFQPHPKNGPQSGRGKSGGRGGKYQEDVHFRNINPPPYDPNQRWVDMAKCGPSNVVPAEHPESSNSSYHTASIHERQPPSSSGSMHTALTSPSKSSSAPYIKVDVGKNHLHLNRDVPYGIPIPVKYARGNSFQDFSVMTMGSHNQFGSFQRNLQTCPKQKMAICEFDSFCLAEHPSSDAGNAPKQWYRGKITKVVGQVGIYFIDLGVEAVVNPEDVYELPLEYVKIWAHAIRLRCLNVKVDEDDPEAVEQFDTLVRDATMKIRITHQDQTVKFRYACYLDVQYMGKWFDAGVLLKKLLIGDRVSEEEIRQEEDKKAIIPLNRMKPPRDPILLEKETEVKVRFVKSPNEFYITTTALVEAYDLIRKLNNVKLPPQKTKFHAGDLSRLFFLIWDQHEKWQRVKVLEVGMEVDKVVVQKIDYGEIVTVPIKALKPIPDDLRFPSCIYKCSLPVKPNNKRGKEMMPLFEQATQTLKTNIFRDIIRVQVFSIENANTHIVDLFKAGSADGLTTCLLRNGLAEATHDFVLNSLPGDAN